MTFARASARSIAGMLFVIVLASSALAQRLPDASRSPEKIGQHVEFEDEIKAVSFSRSTDGYYLSFGGAYPAQVLSVWVSKAIYNHLPAKGALVGRTVRIKGLIEASPTGPLLKLASAESFALVEAEETVLSKAVLDGKMDRDQFMAAVWQIFSRGEFPTLEVLGEELRQSRERFSDGTWISDAFFTALGLKADASNERYAQAEQQIAKWEAVRPGSPLLVVVRAGFHRDRAWRFRGGGYGKTVTAEKSEAFRREVATARQVLDANPAAKMYPEYFAVMQSIALGQGWPKADYFRLFAEATSVELDYYKFYFYAAEYLLPRWHGRKGDWEQFAEEQRQRRGVGGAGDALYARIAWSMKNYYGDLFTQTAISWEAMASGFEFLVREHPQSRWLKNAYANFAWRARDRARLRRMLPDIRHEPDMNVWVNLENLGSAERFATIGR